jgi:tetratricopeptide (TPR) repeat protein
LAQGFLKKAVAADPNAAEARLHFGRVLGLLGRHQEAAAELSQALDAIDDPANEYYASLFLGREEEALGRYDAARRAYERAASLYPGAQSPHLALSQLAWHGADRGGALKALREALAATDDDPWWTYAVVHARQADALLEELRRPFLEDRQ